MCLQFNAKFKTKLTEEKKIYYESNKNENATCMLERRV